MNEFANHSKFPINLQLFNEGDPGAGADPNQSADPNAAVGGNPAGTDPNAASQNQGEFDTIKFNGQDVQIPVTERTDYLQKGYHYDEVRQERDTLKQQSAYLERMAKLSGYQSTEDFVKAIEQLEEESSIEQEAQRLGMDKEAYRQYIAPTTQKVTKLESEVQRLRGLEVDVKLNEMGVQDKTIRQSIRDMVVTKGYPIEDAYKLATYENVRTDAEQNALKNLEQNAATSPGALGADNPNTPNGFSALTHDQKLAFIEKVKRGEV